MIVLFVVAAVSSRAERPTLESLLSTAQTTIETAGHHGDLPAIDTARLAINKALILDPKSPWAWYYKGYAAYIECLLQHVKNDSLAAETAANEADQALEKSIELQRSGEALALHASVLGMLLQLQGPDAAGRIGPRIGQELTEARRLAPTSPRVLMIAGVSALFTPAQWGGDLHRAEKLLAEALVEFDREKPQSPEPAWGRAETGVWWGVAQQKLGDVAKAKKAFEDALALDPDYAWVKHVLLPSVASPSKP